MPVHLTVYRNGLVSRSDYDERYAWSGRFTGTEYYTSDILGSVMLTTDSLGHVTNRYNYDAYGTAYNGSFGGRNKIGYNGKKYDSGTGWYNYGYRDYNPQQGRFSTQDPIRDGMNWYAYCGGDPINYVDLFGLFTESEHITNEAQVNSKNCGDILVGLNLNFVGCIGVDVSIGLVFDLDNPSQSGMFLSGGVAAGVSVGAFFFAGYTNGDFEDTHAATLSVGAGAFGGNLGFADNGNITGTIGVGTGLDAGVNISIQHGIVIPFDTPEQREQSMQRYYNHH